MKKQEKEWTEEEQKAAKIRRSIRKMDIRNSISAVLIITLSIALYFSFIGYLETSDIQDDAQPDSPYVTPQAENQTPFGSAMDTNSTDLSKADVLSMINRATAASASKSYQWTRVCNYTPNGGIDVGSDSVKTVLNNIIGGIAKGENLDSVMGSFIGVGEYTDQVRQGAIAPKMDGHAEYLLKGMELTEEDCQEFSVQGNTYTLHIADCVSPEKDHRNAMHHITDDFVTPASITELVEGNSKGAMMVDKENSKSEFKNIYIQARIENGELLDLQISYVLRANPLGLKVAHLPITVKGKGEIQVVETYKDFQ